jgi:hypothetical protein
MAATATPRSPQEYALLIHGNGLLPFGECSR